MSERQVPHSREDYRHFLPIQTRWADMDGYGHVNNVVTYAWFDTIVNEYLIRLGVLDLAQSAIIGLVVRSGCCYFRELAFPRPIEAGLRVARLGVSSVRYEIGLFTPAIDLAAAQGHFVHVYVDRHTRRPVSLPPDLRGALSPLLAP